MRGSERQGKPHGPERGRSAAPGDGYKWVALSNTTAAVFMSALDGSIVIIALPAIFRGIHLDPLAPGNVSYLLWMIMGYRLVQAVLVVTVGRLGDEPRRVDDQGLRPIATPVGCAGSTRQGGQWLHGRTRPASRGPESVDGGRGQAWPERCCSGAGVQDDAGDEAVTEPVT